MTTHGIERFVKIRPFKPFSVRESSGVTHKVVSLESIRVLPKLGLVVIYPPDETLVMLDPSQITAAFYGNGTGEAPKTRKRT